MHFTKTPSTLTPTHIIIYKTWPCMYFTKTLPALTHIDIYFLHSHWYLLFTRLDLTRIIIYFAVIVKFLKMKAPVSRRGRRNLVTLKFFFSSLSYFYLYFSPAEIYPFLFFTRSNFSPLKFFYLFHS